MNVLVTGAAGFIGFHTAKRFLDEGYCVIGVDSLNDYYDVNLKRSRLEILMLKEKFSFYQLDISDRESIANLFDKFKFDYVVHLAAQAGVRYSIDNPHSYVDSNLVGHMNILEGCRTTHVKHFVYASSSSVYGLNSSIPFSTEDKTDSPASLYAATKKANELFTHSYSNLYGLPSTGLRFFTVYGPWGRPDMALFKFTSKILKNEPIQVYNFGDMRRDFTFISDVVEGIFRVTNQLPALGGNMIPFRVYNIGAGSPVGLMDFVSAVEEATGMRAKIDMMPMQPGDVQTTWADTSDLMEAVNYKPNVGVKEGVFEFVNWYREYYAD